MKNNNTLLVNVKSFKLLMQKYPKIFLIYGIKAIFSSIAPYVYLYLSAQLINELVGLNISKVWNVVRWTLLSTAVLGIAENILKNVEEYYNFVFMADKDSIISNKLMDIKYEDIDKAETYDLLSQIHMNEQYAGYGILKSVEIYKKMIGVVSSICGSAILCFSLFVSRVENDAYSYLNNLGFIILIIIAMLFVSFVSPIISNKAKAYWASKVGQAGMLNRLYSFFGYLAYDFSKALDIRMYKQNEMCEKGYHKFNAFRPGGEVANCAKGAMGLGLALSVAVSYLVTWLIYSFVCLKAWAGAYEIGQIAQYLGALSAMSHAVTEFFVIVGDMNTNKGALETYFSLMDKKEENDGACEYSNDGGDYTIEFKHVYFKYPQTEKWALSDVNCVIRKGEHVAIVGENGSGKTTFIKLLCKLYSPVKGEILINGRNIDEYSFSSYRKFIASVFQDYSLISQPIKNNVSTACECETDRVEKSEKIADISDYVNELKFKGDTFLFKEYSGEGVNVSGGEGQKLSIARAVYKDAPFVILDEPTASLDPVSESRLFENLGEMDADKTVIFISHRLSACTLCDNVMVFDCGEIVQNGNHKLLVKQDGKYRQLWNAQAELYS